MKSKVIAIAALLLAAVAALGQASQQPGTQQPAQQPGAQHPAPGAPAKKGPPMAKSQDEFKAYQAAAQLQQGQDMAAAEAAADEFAVKYPQSDLRALLYQNLMNLYQSANNGDKVVELGRKVVAIEPDNPIALVMIATVLAERTRDTDLDKEERLAEASKDAKHALDSVDNMPIPPGTPPDKAAAAKSTIASMAHGAMGTIATVQQNWAEAESELRKSISSPGIEPDPLTMLRLCITLDHEKKYPEALDMANKTVEQAGKLGQTAVQQLAQQQRDRLVKLSAAPAAGTAPATTPAKPPQF